VLATPRAWIYSTTALWLALSAVWVWFWPAFQPWAQRAPGGYGFYSNLDLLNAALVFLANWMMYFTANQAAASLAAEPNARHRSAVRIQGDPVWYATLLPGSGAVLGQLIAGMLACVPISLAVFVFSAVSSITSSSQPDLQPGYFMEYGFAPIDWLSLVQFNLLYVLRIPQMMLFTMALSIALRRSPAAQSVPWMVTLTAALAAEGESHAQEMSWAYAIARDPFGPGSSPSFWTIMLGAGLLSLAAYLMLRRASAHERPGGRAYLLLLWLCGLPLLGFFLLTTDGYSYWLGLTNLASRVPAVFHAYLAGFLPDLHPFMPPDEAGGDWSLYGRAIPFWRGASLATLAYFASLAFWWRCALDCLRVARRGR
jgi:hypothetical protein